MSDLVRDETPMEFFREQLERAMEHQKVSTSAFTEYYLVNLLSACVQGDRCPPSEPGFDETPLAAPVHPRRAGLAPRAHAPAADDGRHRAVRLRLLRGQPQPRAGRPRLLQGDGRPRLRAAQPRGRRARRGLGRVLRALRPLLRVRGRAGRGLGDEPPRPNHRSVLRLYERWVQTGSRRAAALLAERGIAPVLPRRRPPAVSVPARRLLVDVQRRLESLYALEPQAAGHRFPPPRAGRGRGLSRAAAAARSSPQDGDGVVAGRGARAGGGRAPRRARPAGAARPAQPRPLLHRHRGGEPLRLPAVLRAHRAHGDRSSSSSCRRRWTSTCAPSSCSRCRTTARSRRGCASCCSATTGWRTRSSDERAERYRAASAARLPLLRLPGGALPAPSRLRRPRARVAPVLPARPAREAGEDLRH